MLLARAQNKVALGCCLAGLVLGGPPPACWADNMDTMGVTLLRASQPTLTGAGVPVVQADAMDSDSVPAFEVNYAFLDKPESLFTWISTNGATNVFPNALGLESSHANQVANCFYGPYAGVAPGVAHVDNYEADYFWQYIVADGGPMSGQVVNQSFVFLVDTPSQLWIDSAYDDYIATNGAVFCGSVNGLDSGVGPPGTAYNGIGVGAYGAGAVITDGPTFDNGRSKPDIVAPGFETSFTTPYVAGAAAVLLQAAAAGCGGTNTSEAGDVRTIKALLLNGALKPFDWTHATNAPLDTRYGAGVLNLYYSCQQLAGGQQGFTSENCVSSGSAHPPVSNGPPAGSMAGWNYESVNINPLQDTVDHYLFNVCSNSTLTATLVWERQAGMTNINNLALFLYNATNAALLSCSVSMVDNVQHLYLPHLPPGEYDLEVLTYCANSVSVSETYALAFEFFAMTPPNLSVSVSGGGAIITWPWSPTVYALQETSGLNTPNVWTNATAAEWITNDTVWVGVNTCGNAAYFRLAR